MDVCITILNSGNSVKQNNVENSSATVRMIFRLEPVLDTQYHLLICFLVKPCSGSLWRDGAVARRSVNSDYLEGMER